MRRPQVLAATGTRAVMAILALSWTLQVAGQEGSPAAADAQEKKATILHPKVDKPIPDTYEPLNGTRSEDRDVGTDPIRESWDMKKRQKEREHEEKTKAEEENRNAPATLQKDIPIQDGIPQPSSRPAPAPVVNKDKDSISIHDQ